jgi:peptidoglycan/LPS O-acetylase OafA/YrhL
VTGEAELIYRRDIDGLRAVAIVPVVFYHAAIPFFSGGFVGVDVFFVISGFLITGLIVDDLAGERFSLAHFYERRIRRIFPALMAVMAFCVAAGWIFMVPDDYRRLGLSIIATALFSSNIFFWRQSGYFDGPSNEVPLLHTWSLAVEEQFYILFPLYLIVLTRWMPKYRTAITLVVCLISFFVAAVAVF